MPVDDEQLYLSLLKMPLEASISTLLRCILNYNLQSQKYDFLVYLMPKTLPVLTGKLEKSIQADTESALERARNALGLSRFYLVGL